MICLQKSVSTRNRYFMRKDNVESIYPITPIQHGMLFHANFDQRSSVYVESLNFSIRGNLDIEVFKQAWENIFERQSALRTLFLWKNRETPLQIVRKQIKLPWHEFDWRHIDPADQPKQLEEFLRNNQEQGFDLSRAPLVRLILIREADEGYQFIFCYHHMILDAWSVVIVLEEVFSIYHSIIRSTGANLEDANPFETYVSWLLRQDLTEAEIFWRKTLQDFSEPTSLNFGDILNDTNQISPGFGSAVLNLPNDLTEKLQLIARENRLTLNTLFQGAWALLLSQYTGEKDVLFGAAVSGRSIGVDQIEKLVGLIIGSLPVRIKIQSNELLIDWLQELQLGQVQARKYEYTSLMDIQSWSESRGSQGKALFDSILSFNNYQFEKILDEYSETLEISGVNFLEGSHYPLTMLIDPGETIKIKINYDQERFSNLSITRVLQQLQSLFEDIVSDPVRPLSAYSLLSAEEKQALLFDYNQTATSNPTRIVVRLFEEQVEKSPESVVIRNNDQTITYTQLNEQANKLARYLNKQGVGRGDIVALCLDRSPDVLIAILGTLKAGSAYMPVEVTLPANRIELMLSETQSPVILTKKSLSKRLPNSRANIVYLDSDWAKIDQEDSGNLSQSADLDDLAYIIYTSGSTGTPKGAMITHGNLLNYVSWAENFYLQGNKFDFPLFSSLSFDLTVTSIFVPLVSGGGIVVYGENDASSLSILDVFQDNLVDIVKLTPAHLALIKESNLEGSRVRKLIVGGEDFKRTLAEEITDLFGGSIEIYNEYGPTEATVGCMIHLFDPSTDSAPSVPIGHPINNTQIYILDQDLNPVPIGVIGEMWIGGLSVGRGYLNQPELTAEKFVENPFQPGSLLYRTGDLARWSDNGQLQFLGRRDHQVKIQGYRVELGEIENVLQDHPAIKASVVDLVQTHIKSSNGASMKCTKCGLPGNYPLARLISEFIISSHVTSLPVYAEILPIMADRVDLATFSPSLIGVLVRMAATRSICS